MQRSCPACESTDTFQVIEAVRFKAMSTKQPRYYGESTKVYMNDKRKRRAK